MKRTLDNVNDLALKTREITAENHDENRAELARLRKIEEAANAIIVSDGNMNADAIGEELLDALRAALEDK